MRLFHDISKQVENIKLDIKYQLASILETAQEIYLLYENDSYRVFENKIYSDIYDFCKVELDLSRKTVNKYLDVVNVYFKYKKSNNYNDFDTYKFEYKNLYFVGMNFSQLYACIGLSDIECSDLMITKNTSVHEIEKRKKEYKKLKNDIKVPKTEDQKEEVQSMEEDKTFDSLSDSKRGINIFENDYIPENSEFEIIFRKDNTLIRGRKRKCNFNTSLKMLRTYLENNPEDDFYYGVVKIKKPL